MYMQKCCTPYHCLLNACFALFPASFKSDYFNFLGGKTQNKYLQYWLPICVTACQYLLWSVQLTVGWEVGVKTNQDVYLFLGEKLYSLSVSFSPPRNINGYKKIIRKALENAGESLDGLTSNTEGVVRFFVKSCCWNLDKLWPDGPGDL